MATSPLIFYTHVTPDDAVRAASIAAEETLDRYSVDVEMRVDVYQAMINAQKNIEKDGTILTPEEQRLVEKMILDGKRAGLGLPDKEREKLKTVSLCILVLPSL